MKPLKSFDLFGVPYSWNLNGHSRYRTNTGLAFTVLFCALSIATIVFFILQLTSKQSAYVSESVFFDTNPEQVEINNKIFKMAVGLEHAETDILFIDESIY